MDLTLPLTVLKSRYIAGPTSGRSTSSFNLQVPTVYQLYYTIRVTLGAVVCNCSSSVYRCCCSLCLLRKLSPFGLKDAATCEDSDHRVTSH